MIAVTKDNIPALEELLKGEVYTLYYNIPYTELNWDKVGVAEVVVVITKNRRVYTAVQGDGLEMVGGELRINPMTTDDYIRKGYRVYSLSATVGTTKFQQVQRYLFNKLGLSCFADKAKDLLYVY